MHSIVKMLGLAVALALVPMIAEAQVVTCRLSPYDAQRYTGGGRDCRTSHIDSNGTCYCQTRAGPIGGSIVGGARYRGDYGGGQPVLRCRISPNASRYTGGDRDCSVRSAGPGGTCTCPSAIGPIRGYIVQGFR
jgi:hypothetical protein